MNRLIYLDHAATTPMREDAVEAMLPFLTERFANPSGSHRFARDARRAVDEARDVVAAVIGCRPGEVVFTGCGTEADNAAIAGAVARRGGRAVCPATEHHAVLHAVERLGGTVVAVDAAGRVDLAALEAALGADVSVVSVMAVNNEVGSITDLAAVRDLVRRQAPGAVLHTDAVQAATWLDLRSVWPHVDLLSLSAHKFGGPKGVGVLAVREGVVLDPLIVGGGQERERRSGTHNVAGIVALAVALEATDAERATEVARIAALRDRLVAGLVAGVPGLRETVAPADKVAGSAHVLHRGHRERVAAVPARRGRGVRLGGVGLRERRDGAVARAGGDGHRPALGGRFAAPHARPHDDRRRRRRRGGGDHVGRRHVA